MTLPRRMLVCLLSLVAAAPLLAAPRTVAVLPMASDGVPDEELGQIAGELLDELRRLPDVEVRRLGGSGTFEGVPTCLYDDLACLTALGAHLGVSHVVAGLVTPVAGGFRVQLNAVDTRAETTAATADVKLLEAARPWAPVVREAVTRLLSPDALTGVLVVSVNKAGATVLLDGVVQGTSPLADPLTGVPPGRHQLEVRLAGHTTVRRFVRVSFGEVTSERVALVAGDGVDASGTDVAPVPVDDGAGGAGPDMLLAGAGGVTAGVGVLLVAGGVATLLVSSSAFATVPPAATPAEREALVTEALAQLSLWSGVGCALIGAGAVVTLGGAGMFAASYLVE